MFFLHSLYTLSGPLTSSAEIHVSGRLDADHAVFRAHFPGQPVLPGVVMLQLVEELWREAEPAGAPLRLERVVNAKFIRPVMPDVCAELSFTLSPSLTPEGGVKLKAEVKSAGQRCALFSLLFSPAAHE